MIVLVARVHVKPSKREDFIKVAQGMLEPSRDEKGCISYNFFADTLDSGFFHFFEEWESQEALKKHSQSDHYQRYSQAIAELLEKPSELRVYTVSKVELR